MRGTYLALLWALCATLQVHTTPPPISTFWKDEAHFEFVSKARFPTYPGGPYAMNVGFYFRIIDDVWYLFHREYYWETQPAYCKADFARIVVRTSKDKGVTWSNKTVVISPVEGTPYECAIVDGASWFDEKAQTWHYLGQCMNRTRVWDMCHFYRKDASPLGPFTANPHNPVVRGGQLWSQICAGSGKHCDPSTTHDEGTPDIIAQDSQGFYYVTFHGWDPTHDKSYRGVAKTLDFVAWQVSDGNSQSSAARGPDGVSLALPDDAMFSSIDCNKWNISWAKGGCVGGGEGSILTWDGYFYELIEAPDLSLGCLTKPGEQNWVVGLLRSPNLGRTGTWEQFRVSPLLVPAVKQGCYIQYHRLFRNAKSGQVFLEYWADNFMQVFELKTHSGTLPIVAGPPPDAPHRARPVAIPPAAGRVPGDRL